MAASLAEGEEQDQRGLERWRGQTGHVPATGQGPEEPWPRERLSCPTFLVCGCGSEPPAQYCRNENAG